MDNPYYISIDIPESEEEKGIAASDLLKATADILDAADVCASGTVLSLDLAQRAELEVVNSASDETLQKDEVRLNTNFSLKNIRVRPYRTCFKDFARNVNCS